MTKRASPVLQVRNLTTRLRLGGRVVTVVDDVSFDLMEGKTLAIVGESGSGKTMTALSLLRILPQPPALPPEGQVLLGDQDLLKISERRLRSIRGRRVSMIFQDPMGALNPVYTIGDQLFEVARQHLGLRGKAAMERMVASLDEVGIVDPEQRLHDYPHQLSGGMKQRVMIAMALMCEPEVLIADEPTTALDVTVQKQVLELIKDLQRRKGTSVLLITHDMGVVAEVADDVVVMYATQTVEQAPVHQLFDHLSHPYTQGLFRSLPSSHQPGEPLHVIEGGVPSLSKMPQGCHFHPRCPHVMDQCRQGPVPCFGVGESHSARCWLHRDKQEVRS